MENIKLTLGYTAGYCNGWPLINIYVNNQWCDAFEANGSEHVVELCLDPGPVQLSIEHWGKNPITDSQPTDKFFALEHVELEHVVCDFLLSTTTKTIKPDPWTRQYLVSQGDNYLGHNGTLSFRFDSPVRDWLKTRQQGNDRPMSGQETTRQMLEHARRVFKIERSLK
jgi:hypothetical protein